MRRLPAPSLAAMHQALLLHPDSRCAAVARIDTEALRPRPDQLALRYAVTGAVSALRLPAAIAAPTRADDADELWRHTCFEAFLRAEDGGYYEFNLAPSTHWAAYRFSGYREGMRTAETIPAPHIEVREGANSFELEAILDFTSAPSLARAAPWRLALSAVIEDTSGGLSYWALRHPRGKPDFHHSDSFCAELPAA